MSYEYRYVKFKSSESVTYSGEPYSFLAEYSLVDGVDEKGNYAVPSSGVDYNGAFFTINSDFDTGIPISDIRGVGGGGPYTLGVKFKLDQNPSSNIYFFANNLGDSNNETLLYIDSVGELYCKDRVFGTTKLTNFHEIGNASNTKTYSELYKVGQYNSLIFAQNTAGNGKIYLNGFVNTDEGSVNPLITSLDNWEIITNDEVSFFNIVYWDLTTTDQLYINYNEAEAQETFPINFPDGDNAQEFIFSKNDIEQGYGSADRKIFNEALTIGDVKYTVNESGLQQVQNSTISFSNVGQFYHQMQELNGLDFWNTLEVSIYWANSKVNTLIYDGADWKADGETVVSFTPSETYPLIDSIKKEFVGHVNGLSINKDTVSLPLVSASKTDAYLIGTSDSGDGADASRSKINPIVIGDMTDEFAYIPAILNNNLYSIPSAICSDIDLTEAPTVYIYDEKAERFYTVDNKQTSLENNKVVSFYDATIQSNSLVKEGGFVSMDGESTQLTEEGEVISRFSNNRSYFSIGQNGGYDNPRAYIFNDSADIQDVLHTEGTRNYDGLTDLNTEGNVSSIEADEESVKARATIKVNIKPTSIHVNNTSQIDFDTNSSISNFTAYEKLTYSGNINAIRVTEDAKDTKSSDVATIGGRYKSVLEYDDFSTTQFPHDEAKDENTPYIYLAPYSGEITNGVKGEYDDFDYYNFENYFIVNLGFDLQEFGFSGQLLEATYKLNGGRYSYFKKSDDPFYVIDPVNFANQGYAIRYEDKDGDTVDQALWFSSPDYIGIEDNASIKVSNQFSNLDTVEDFYNSNPRFVFAGMGVFNPVKTTQPNYSTDFDDPSYFGRTRYAIDGVEFDLDVSAVVESKYWCCKAKTGDALSLEEGVNQLATRYNQPSLTTVDSLRDGWEIAGATIGKPIYYRDILSRIADEFKVFISEDNGVSIVSKGEAVSSWTFDSSNVFMPWNESVKLSETSSDEVYNKIVVKCAYNHMNENYGRQVTLSTEPTDLSKAGPLVPNDFRAIFESVELMGTATETLNKIGINEKILNVELDYIRGGTAFAQHIAWLARNHYRKRAKATIEVSKRYFLNGKIGDGVKLDLPKLPSFYKNTMQVTKITNRSANYYSVELEEFL